LSDLIFPPQVRTEFDDDEDRRLGASMKNHGQVQPIVVGPDGITVLIGGRRGRALRLIGEEFAEVKILDRMPSDSELKTLQLVENLHRASLSGYDQWVACTEILSMNVKWGGKELAEELHLDPSSITRLLSPSKCVGEVQDALKAGKIGISDCYAISKLPHDKQLGLLALKLSGASRDALEEAGRKARSTPAKPASKVSRAQLVLTSGIKIVVSGAAICVESLLDAFADAAKELRKAREQNLTVKTLEAVLKSKAKKGAAS
jgi:ParB family chromosome partitioning protein